MSAANGQVPRVDRFRVYYSNGESRDALTVQLHARLSRKARLLPKVFQTRAGGCVEFNFQGYIY